MNNNTHTRLYSVISYFTWIGWLISYFLRDKNDNVTRQHVNQALILNICNTVISILSNLFNSNGVMTIVIGVVSLALLVIEIIGIVRAFQMSDKPIPVIGEVRLINN